MYCEYGILILEKKINSVVQKIIVVKIPVSEYKENFFTSFFILLYLEKNIHFLSRKYLVISPKIVPQIIAMYIVYEVMKIVKIKP